MPEIAEGCPHAWNTPEHPVTPADCVYCKYGTDDKGDFRARLAVCERHTYAHETERPLTWHVDGVCLRCKTEQEEGWSEAYQDQEGWDRDPGDEG